MAGCLIHATGPPSDLGGRNAVAPVGFSRGSELLDDTARLRAGLQCAQTSVRNTQVNRPSHLARLTAPNCRNAGVRTE